MYKQISKRTYKNYIYVYRFIDKLKLCIVKNILKLCIGKNIIDLMNKAVLISNITKI